MKDDINLTLRVGSEKKQMSQVVTICLALFFVFLIIALALIFYAFVLSGKSSTLGTTQTDLTNKIAALSSTKEKMLTLEERLTSIRKIIATRKKLDARMLSVLSVVPKGASIEGVTADEKLISVNLSSASLADFNTLLETRLPQFTKDKPAGLSRINIKSFDQQGSSYLLSLDFYFSAVQPIQQQQRLP